jgi:hypothetical protein
MLATDPTPKTTKLKFSDSHFLPASVLSAVIKAASPALIVRSLSVLSAPALPGAPAFLTIHETPSMD